MGAIRNKLREERGVIFILFIVVLLVLVAFAALALDVGNVMVVRNEVQNVADACALAGARFIGHTYEGMTYTEQVNYVFTRSDIVSVVQSAGLSNKAGGENITINDADVVIGDWDPDLKVLTPSNPLKLINAVRVTARRDSLANGPISTFFARILGINTVDVSGKATAALNGQDTVASGGLPVPLGISHYWFENPEMVNYCNQNITFYPTNDPSSCAGWHVYDSESTGMNNFNDRNLRTIIDELNNGTYSSPEIGPEGISFNFGGGTMSQQTFDAMYALWQANLNVTSNGNQIVSDPCVPGECNAWKTGVPVYERSDCSNPGPSDGPIPIVNFSTIVITNVQTAPSNQIVGYVLCDYVVPGRGGGTDTGTFGSIPGLVQ